MRLTLALVTGVLVAAIAGSVPVASARAACPDEAVREQQHSTYLPDCRAFEMVSPPQKNGGGLIASSLRTWAADDGNAVVFASLAGFGDVVGTNVTTDYVAKRVAGEVPLGSQGWSVHAITPPQGSLPTAMIQAGFEPMDVLFTPDLDAGVYQSWNPLSGDPNVAGVANLYLRHGIRDTSSPSVELATACPFCVLSGKPLASFAQTSFNMLPKVAGLSGDGTHVLFESVLKLTSEATDGTESGQVNLYEYANGTVQDVGILPDGSPAAGAVAGQGVGGGETVEPYLPHALSSDGTRVVFTASPTTCDGRYPCGNLYLRDTSSAPGTTVQINASERTTPDPGGPQPAKFWTMSTDGERVFFTTKESLTNDNTGGAGLYMFDAAAPVGKRLTRISVQEPGGGGADVDIVLGASDDGRTVYFTSSAPLLAGDPPFVGDTRGIYVWRDPVGGSPQLRFIAPLAEFAANHIEDEIAGSVWSLQDSIQSRVSADGRFLLFSATNGDGVLSLYGQKDYKQGKCTDVGVTGCRELYRYDALASTPQSQLQCVSCRPDGVEASVSATDMSREFIGGSQSSGILDHALASDGRVFFTTAEALVPEDVNGQSDVYEWQDGHVHLLTDGQSSSGGSYFLDASPGGGDVFVASSTQLSGWDTDGSYDLYDVRESLPGHPAGVFDPSPPGCAGEECVGQLLGPPPPSTFSSATFAGAGNIRQVLAKAVKCKAGAVRKRTSSGVRCVRKPKRKPVHCPRLKARGKKCSKLAAHGGRNGRTR